MDSFPWVIAGLVLGLLLIGVGGVMLWKKREKLHMQANNYRTLFILGVIFLPLGVIYGIIYAASGLQVLLVLCLAFIAMGLIYSVIGLANRSKWNG